MCPKIPLVIAPIVSSDPEFCPHGQLQIFGKLAGVYFGAEVFFMSWSVMVSSYSDVKHASLWTVMLVFQQFTVHTGDLSLREPSRLTNICHQFPLI